MNCGEMSPQKGPGEIGCCRMPCGKLAVTPRSPWWAFSSLERQGDRTPSQIVCRRPLPELRAGTWASSTVKPTRRSRWAKT